MYSSLLSTLLFIILESLVASAKKCLDQDLRQCMKELKVLTGSQDLAFAMTERELNLSCRHLRDAMDCVNNFTNHCLDQSQRDIYRALTSGAQDLILDLCTPESRFRKEYLAHAPCFKSLKDDYKKCTDQYSANQEALKNKDLTSDMKLRKSCCFFDAYRDCTRTAVLAKCSSEAAEVGTQIVTKAGGPLVQAYCSGFKHDSQECSMEQSSASNLSPMVVTTTLLLAILTRTFM